MFLFGRGISCRSLVRLIALLVVLPLFNACAYAPVHTTHNPLATWMPSPNYNERAPSLIVIHFTQENSLRQALRTLRTHNSEGRVSAHYLIGRDGHIYQLVADNERAWHAGQGRWGTITDVNSAALGIELDNTGDEAFPPEQIQSLLTLLSDLTSRWHIPRSQVIGHEDLAPTRRSDPGQYFPWKELASHGFGLWPRGELLKPPPGFDPWLALAALGYSLDNRGAAVHAFHNHYRGIGGNSIPGNVIPGQKLYPWSEDKLDARDISILYTLVHELGDD
jgi:N-acetylmuramoyl-L-alanine amidase